MNGMNRLSSNEFWPDQRTVWRWHFYAGIFCMPFVVVLSISGAIYLFKTEIESWNERTFDRLVVEGQPASAKDQIQAALTAVTNSSLEGYEIQSSSTSATRVILKQAGEAIRVYVHPESCEVLQSSHESQRFMRTVFRLHGELLMGDRGSMIVELAASWTIIMILTGLFLWWPRHSQGLGGVLFPRLNSGKRIVWRDMHAVTGIWISFFAMFLLVSGLPWAKFWGEYFKTVRRITGTAVAQQEWSNSGERIDNRQESSGSGEHAGHTNRSARPVRDTPDNVETPPIDLDAIDRIISSVSLLNLASPVVISPPKENSQTWTVKSMTPNRPWRETLTVDGDTGAIKSRNGFRDKHWIDQVIAVGTAAHEGRLFGAINQFIGLLTAAGLVMLSTSGFVLWWKRRNPGVLGAPKAIESPCRSLGLLVIVVTLGIALPLFGASLVAVLLLEKLLLRRIAPVRTWLGLNESNRI